MGIRARRTAGAVAVFIWSLVGSAWAADGTIGYGQATGYFKQATRPTLYQPLNLLDGRSSTAWCSPSSDPLNELLSFGFNGKVSLDELRIANGNGFDASTFAEFARAKKLLLRSGKQSRSLELADQQGPQSVAISPPLAGARFTLEVLDQYPAEDLDAPVCLTDVVFAVGGRALNGPWLTTKLKYDKHVAALMGVWFGGYDTTPDRFLAFNFDGTFRYTYEPFEATRAQREELSGTYDVSAGRLTLVVAGKRHSARWTKESGKKGFALRLDGELPEPLTQPFRSLP